MLKKAINAVLCLLIILTVPVLAGCGNEADSFYKQGQKYVSLGSYVKAADSYRKAIKLNGDRSDYYIGLGIAESASGNYEDALKQFEKAVNPSENSVSKSYAKQARYGEADAYLNMGDHKNAMKYAKMAEKYSEPDSLDADIRITEAAALILKGDTEKAEKLFPDIIKKYPGNARAHFEYAAAYEKEKNYSDAVNELESAVEKDKDYTAAYFKLADVYAQDNKVSQAKSVLKKIAGIKASTGEDYFNKGKAYFKLSDDDNAEKYFDLAVKNGYDCTYLFIGRIYARNGDYENAAQMYEKALEDDLQKNNRALYSDAAECFAAAGNFKKAAEYSEKILDLGRKADRKEFKDLVIYEEKSGEYEKALEYAERYEKQYSDSGMEREISFIKMHIDNAGKTQTDETGEKGKDASAETKTPSDAENTSGPGTPAPSDVYSTAGAGTPTPSDKDSTAVPETPVPSDVYSTGGAGTPTPSDKDSTAVPETPVPSDTDSTAGAGTQ